MASSSSEHLHLLLPLFLCVALLVPFISCDGDGDDLTVHQCIQVDNNPAIPTAVNKTLSVLLNVAPQRNFAYTHHSPLYGLAWCRGDFSAINCSRCLTKAAARLTVLCSPQAIAARLVYGDFCYLRLDTEDFFTRIDVAFGRILYDPNETEIVEAHRMIHWSSVERLLGELKKTILQRRKRFKKLEVDFRVENSTIHGMGQCLKEMSGKSCEFCLDNTIQTLKDNCTYRKLCQVFHGSCFLQFYT